MKRKTLSLILMTLMLGLIFGCSGNKMQQESAKSEKSEAFYFEYTIDGEAYTLDTTDILTTYNEFSATDREFKIFAGKEQGPNLVITLISDLSKPSSTANGSPEAGSKLNQGSVSLQNYPTKGFTFNSYDYLLNPKPEIIADAVVITNSEQLGEIGRILTGTINVVVRGGENKQNDPAIKDYTIKGKFRIKHLFKGLKF